jgi:hypothetical protein
MAERKHLRTTWKTAWNALNKAHTLLMADRVTQPLAHEVIALMTKLDALVERTVTRSRRASHASHAAKPKSALAFQMAKEAWEDDPTARTAQKYRQEAREVHRNGMLSNSALEAVIAETAAYAR